MAVNERDTGGAPGSAERDPRLDRLYRETAHEAPPAPLDAAILAAARREAGSRPRRALSTVPRQWRLTVSLAAVIVLSVSLVMLVREENGGPLLYTPLPPATPPVGQPPVEPAPPPVEAVRVQPRAAAPVPARPAPRDDARVGGTGDSGLIESNARRDAAPPAGPGAAPAPPPETAAKAPPQPYPAAPRAAEQRAAASPHAEDAAGGREAAGAPAAATNRAAPPMATGSLTEPARTRAMARAKPAETPAPGRVPPWHGLEKEPPQKWLERMVELKRQERAAEVEETLAEFKRRFPDYPLPAGLQ